MAKTILIYQMGKVGSATIQRSLSRSRLTWLPVPEDKPLPILPQDKDVVLHTHSHGRARAIINLPEHRDKKRMLIVLSLTRDLLRRTVSAFFENISRAEHPLYLGPQGIIEKMPVEDIIAAFREREWIELETYALPWFDEYGASVNSDIFSVPFFPCGYRQYPSDIGRVAVMRMENIDGSQEWLRRFFSTPPFSIKRENDTSDTWKGEIYKRFLERFRPSAEELDVYYDSKLMRYFYRPAEIQQFRRRWEAQSLASAVQ